MQHFLSLSLCVTYNMCTCTQLDTMTKARDFCPFSGDWYGTRWGGELSLGAEGGGGAGHRACWGRCAVQSVSADDSFGRAGLGPFKGVESADSSGGCTLESQFEVFIFGRKWSVLLYCNNTSILQHEIVYLWVAMALNAPHLRISPTSFGKRRCHCLFVAEHSWKAVWSAYWPIVCKLLKSVDLYMLIYIDFFRRI